ncbi:MAG: hypothetical protein HY850_07410 [Betaproteobacteria bacterium]|nr:hypothetical protein [Betaproteobacteria bacterium]
MSESLNVLMHLALALGVMYFCGYGLTRLCGRDHSMMPAVGYAASQVLFFGFYFAFFDADAATAAVFVAAGILNVASLRVPASALSGVEVGRPGISRTAIGGVIVLLLAAWPYLLAGWGNYWHSGNEDAFDAINGRDAYVHQDVAIQEYWEAMRQAGWGKGPAGEAQPIVQTASVESLVAVYAEDIGRLQYSSAAFWSVVLDAKHGMDAWLVQALLNLLLMAYGLVILLKRVLPLGWRQASILATAAVANNFYLSTYFNGHQGSLMFAAVAPFGLLLTLDFMEQRHSLSGRIRNAVLLAVLLLFVVGAYPYPLPFFLLALFIYWFLRRHGGGFLGRRYLIAVLLSLLMVAYVGAWFLFEPIRDRAAMQFRSWGTVFNAVGFFQFWGIWPSMLASASSEFMNWLINNRAVMLASYLVGSGLCGLAMYGLYRGAKLGYFLFVAFAVMWLALFPFMRFIVGDSYYFYKFLYLNNFFVIVLMLFGYLQLKSGRLPKTLTIAASSLVGLWVILNMAGNVWATWVISNKPYNAQAAEFQGLITKLQANSKDVYIDLPKRGKNGAHLTDYESVVRSYLWSAGLQYEHDAAKAKYLLRMNGLDDVAEQAPEKALWQTALFRLIEAPASSLLTIKSYWAPEHDRDARMADRIGYFRWVSDGESNWFAVNIVRPGVDARFLHFCAETGPSVDYRPLTLRVSDGSGNDIDEIKVERYGCHWIDLAGRQGPFRLSSEAMGHVFSLLDTRHLNFRIFNVGISSAKYDLATLRYLNEPDDITPRLTAEALRSRHNPDSGAVYLINGWHDLERQAGEKFRWAQAGAQLLVDDCPGELVLDIAPGPSLGRPEMDFSVRTPLGQVLAASQIKGRSVLRFPVDAKVSGHVLELMADSAGLVVPGDSRRLDFRIFGITWSKVAGAGHCLP